METQIIFPSDQPAALSPIGDTPLSENPAAVYIASLPSAHSKRNMLRYLNQIAAMLLSGENALTLNWGAVRVQHTEAIRAQLHERYAAATVNNMLSALRGVLTKAWVLEQMTAEHYQRAVMVKNVKGETLPAGRDISRGEISALVDACYEDENKRAGLRDAAIIAILYTCGLRRAELAALKLDNVEINTGKISVRRGKGNKARTVYATNGTLLALKDWLAVRGIDGEALFTPIRKNGEIVTGERVAGKNKKTVTGLTAQAIYEMLLKRGNEAGVENFSPHDFRRTFAGDMMDAGVDITTVAKIMGHSNVETTARYDRRPEETKKDAAKHLHFPHQRRAG